MHGEWRGLSALMHRPGLKNFESGRIRSSLKSLGFDTDDEGTNTSGYFCHDYLAAEDARY